LYYLEEDWMEFHNAANFYPNKVKDLLESHFYWNVRSVLSRGSMDSKFEVVIDSLPPCCLTNEMRAWEGHDKYM
jgi:hypothetical protein